MEEHIEHKIEVKGEHTIEKHESFGLASFGRLSSSGPHNLFGSSIGHSHTIRLEINRASLNRHLNQDWYYPEDRLIIIEMSQTQFGDLISSMNTSGVPVTIRYIGKKAMENCPDKNAVKKVSAEMDKELKDLGTLPLETATEIMDYLEKEVKLPKKHLSAIEDKLHRLTKVFGDTLPFIKDQFVRAVSTSVSYAKGEIEAFWLHKLHALGLKKLSEGTSSPVQLPDLSNKEEQDEPKLP